MLTPQGILLCSLILYGFVSLGSSSLEVKLLHVLLRHGDKVPHKEFQNYPNDPHGNLTYYPMGSGGLTNLLRHGDKVPHKEFQNYPNDPHGNLTYYPMGSGGLTNEGKSREYKIGTKLREEYDKFFGPYYWPDLIYGRSTDVPRTQMSLQLVLAGLFPPTERQMWNPRLPWLPVFTGFVPNEQDSLLFPHHCPQYVKEYKSFLQQEDVKKMLEKHRSVMEFLTEKTGKRVDTTSAVYYLYNLFKEQAAQNLTLPKWTEKVYPNPMREITALDYDLRSHTKSLKRLNAGPLLHEITEGMKALRGGTLNPANRKAFFYSAHELNVAAMARSLGTDDPVIPLYGSTIIFETLQDERQRFYVRIRLWTGVTEQLINQKIPGCSELCPLDEFLKILQDVIASKEEANCYAHPQKDEQDESHDSSRKNDSSSSQKTSSSHWILMSVIPILFYRFI